MFRKNKDGSPDFEAGTTNPGDTDQGGAPPLKPFSKKGSHNPARPPATGAQRTEIPRRVMDIPGPNRRPDRPRPVEAESKTLIVGREIRLSGQITSCDRLVVEGHVEVSLSDARLIEVAPTGYFKGSAQADEADISGCFDGELVANERLTVRSTGRISGSIRYGRIIIESGGEITGDMQALGQRAEETSPAAEPTTSGPDEAAAADYHTAVPADAE